jgi:hypothetical protein
MGHYLQILDYGRSEWQWKTLQLITICLQLRPLRFYSAGTSIIQIYTAVMNFILKKASVDLPMPFSSNQENFSDGQ